MPSMLRRLLDSPLLSRIRRNHALEHATIHVLSSRFPRRPLVGRSDAQGFYLYADVPLESVLLAAQEALARLKAGERQLALHPNCGTSLLTAGALAGTASFFTLLGGQEEGWRDRLGRLPLAVMVTVLALIVAQPLGMTAQRLLTTEADPHSLQVDSIRPVRGMGSGLFRVLTRG